jgi:hypothetical protein
VHSPKQQASISEELPCLIAPTIACLMRFATCPNKAAQPCMRRLHGATPVLPA